MTLFCLPQETEFCCCCSVAKLCPTLWDSSLQHTRLLSPTVSPIVCSNSCQLSQWCHTIISSSVTPFSSCPQSFPGSMSFPMSQLFASGGQSIGVPGLSSGPSNEYSRLIAFRVNRFDLLAVQGTLKSLHQHHSLKAPIIQHSAFLIVQLSHPYVTTGKTIALTIRTFVGKGMSLTENSEFRNCLKKNRSPFKPAWVGLQ